MTAARNPSQGTRWTEHQRLWMYRGLTFFSTVLVFYVLTLWAVPRLIMWRLMTGPVAQQLNAYNRAAYPPPVTAQSRTVVMPSPDLLYSVCIIDTRKGPVHISAHPQLDSYWSIALYSANSDNYFVMNDRQAGQKPVDFWLVSDHRSAANTGIPPGAKVVFSPSDKGFLLMRVLTGNYAAEKDRIEPARRSLQCQGAPLE